MRIMVLSHLSLMISGRYFGGVPHLAIIEVVTVTISISVTIVGGPPIAVCLTIAHVLIVVGGAGVIVGLMVGYSSTRWTTRMSATMGVAAAVREAAAVGVATAMATVAAVIRVVGVAGLLREVRGWACPQREVVLTVLAQWEGGVIVGVVGTHRVVSAGIVLG